MRITSKLSHKGASRRKGLIINLHVVCTLYQYGFVCLCFTSLQQRGHLETAAHLLSLAKDVKLGIYTVPTGNEPRAVAWQSITLLLRHASSILWFWISPVLLWERMSIVLQRLEAFSISKTGCRTYHQWAIMESLDYSIITHTHKYLLVHKRFDLPLTIFPYSLWFKGFFLLP